MMSVSMGMPAMVPAMVAMKLLTIVLMMSVVMVHAMVGSTVVVPMLVSLDSRLLRGARGRAQVLWC